MPRIGTRPNRSGFLQSFTTFGDMLAYIRANPGKMSMGVSDSVTLVVASAFKAATNTDFIIVPYKGGGNQAGVVQGNPVRMFAEAVIRAHSWAKACS